MGRWLPPRLLAMPTGYSCSEFLNTSETIEFILDFSTGLMTGDGKLCESRSVPAGTRVVSDPHFTVTTPLLTIRCDYALRSFEIAEPFLLLGAKNLVDFGLHASVRDHCSA
jgi:hypothetical protein